MSKFSRSWTMHIKTDVEGFKEAFFKVVQKKYNENYWGSMFSKSFSIYKHREESMPLRLDGEIIEAESGLLLELYLQTDYDNTWMRFKVFVFSYLLAFGIGSLLSIWSLIEDYFFVATIILTVLMFPLVFRLALWMTNAAVNGLQHDFIVMLKEIEKHIVCNGL